MSKQAPSTKLGPAPLSGRARRVAIVLLVIDCVGAGHAAPLVQTDFNQGIAGWRRNSSARLLKLGPPDSVQLLQLSPGTTWTAGTAWTELRSRVPSFSFIADVRVRFTPKSAGDCPADGFALAFAPVETDAVGGWGSGLGLLENEEIRQFIAVEVNTWSGQGLGTTSDRNTCLAGKNETFAFDVLKPSGSRRESSRLSGGGTPERGGYKIGQTLPPPGLKIVNGGWYRYQWNVASDGTMTLYITGLSPANQQFQKVKVLEVKLAWSPLDTFDGRWGLTAATGGLAQITEVARVTIESPMVPPQ